MSTQIHLLGGAVLSSSDPDLAPLFVGYDEDEHLVYMWTEGNYSCDCNKSRFLGLDAELPCGHTLDTIKVVRGGKTLFDVDGGGP